MRGGDAKNILRDVIVWYTGGWGCGTGRCLLGQKVDAQYVEHRYKIGCRVTGVLVVRGCDC